MPTPDAIVDTVLNLNPLSDLPRTGWLLRGVRPCESIADHCFAVGVVSSLLVDALRAEGVAVNGERVLQMALVHDATEARTGDLPMPVKSGELEASMRAVERGAAQQILAGSLLEAWEEAEAAETLEAKIVRGADKIQLMIKVLAYEGQGRGQLDEFWASSRNFRDMGLPCLSRVYDCICKRAGRDRPR